MSDTIVRRAQAEAAAIRPAVPAKQRAKESAQGVLNRGGVRVFALLGEPLAKLMLPRIQGDPYPFYAELRSTGPVVQGKRIPFAITTTYELAHSITRDARFGVDNRLAADFKPAEIPEGSPLRDMPRDNEMILFMDAPDHTRVRRLVSRAFTPRAVEGWRPRVERIANDLLDRVLPSGGMELVEEYASELPILVISEMLGVPASDRAQFKRWGDDVVKTLALVVTPADKRRASSSEFALVRYFEYLFSEHRANPTDDLLSALIAAEEDGDRLTHRELIAQCMLLLLAGFETTMNLITNGTVALLQNPDQLADLRGSPELMANATDELLRYDSPVQFTSRTAIEDVEVAGVVIQKGQQLGVLIGGANNDPAVFENPRRLNIRRENAKDHVAFSSGPHYCLGASLARLEGEVAFAALLERCPTLRLAGKPVRKRNELLRGYARLPLAFS